VSEQLLVELKERISNRGVIVVAGTGVSANTVDASQRHLTSWQKWLLTGIERCRPTCDEKWCQRRREDIESGDLRDMLLAAQSIQEKLGGSEGGEFASWIKQTVGSLEVKYPELIKAIGSLRGPITTTNYDSLIEDVTGLERATWKEQARAQEIINGQEQAVLHLHGHHLESHTLIVSSVDYYGIQTKELTQHLQKTMATRSSLLFVGCGGTLEDPNLGGLVDWLRDFRESKNRHYLLVRNSEVENFQKKYPLTETRIVVLGYGDDYSDLPGFLAELAPPSVEKTVEEHVPAVNLPGKPRFIGREIELNDLVQTLLEPEPRPVPIMGTLGIGKSNLCQTMLYHPKIIERYGNRRFFIRCDGAINKAALVSEIARQLHVPEGPYLDFRLEQELKRATVLLVLDNFETPWQADTQDVETYLATLCSIGGLSLVITLRSMTRPRGVPWRDPIEPKLLPEGEAKRLFLEVSGGRFANDPHLDKLIADLDGLPLAIELLAMRAEGEPNLKGLWQQWQSKRSKLLKRDGVAEDRLSSFAASFELSFDKKQNPRMTQDAQRLVTLLGQLPDGIAHSDLNALLSPGGEDAATVLRKVGLAFSDAERLRMLAPLREYANRHHPPTPDDNQAMIKHYCQLAEEQGWTVGRESGQEAVKRIVDDYANLTNITQAALATDDEDSQNNGIDAVLGLAEYARFTGENLDWLVGEAITLARHKDWTQQEANCIRSLGNIALERSDHDTARTQYEKALPLYQKIGSILGEANCIQSLGDIALRRSDHATARTQYEKALPLYQKIGSILGEANCIRSLGDIALRRSDHATARTQYEKALPLYQKIGSILGEANCIQSLGDIALRRSDHDTARTQYEKALTLYARIPEPYSMGWTHVRLSRISSQDSEKAEHIAQARQLWTSIERPDLVKLLDDEFGNVGSV
jgi:tetratricopeptide (TPR) repeat protein